VKNLGQLIILGELEVKQIELDNSTEYSKESEKDYYLSLGLCNCENCINNKNINMLNKDQTNTLISIIDKLEDSSLKDEFLSQLNNLIIKSEEVREQIEPINMKDIYKRFKVPNQNITIKDLQEEIKNLKQEIQLLKENDISLEYRLLELEGKDIIRDQHKIELEPSNDKAKTSNNNYINLLSLITTHKWHTEIKLVIKGEIFITIALIDSGVDVNCIQEGLIPIQYYEKTLEKVTSTNGSKMNIQYKLSNAKICKGKICYNTSFVLIKNMNTCMILGTPFLTLLYPFQVTEKWLITNTMNK